MVNQIVRSFKRTSENIHHILKQCDPPATKSKLDICLVTDDMNVYTKELPSTVRQNCPKISNSTIQSHIQTQIQRELNQQLNHPTNNQAANKYNRCQMYQRAHRKADLPVTINQNKKPDMIKAHWY